jgi:hypothetical protein
MVRQDAERHDFGFVAKREGQRERDRDSFRPPDSAKEPRDAHYLLDRSGVPRIFRKTHAAE